MKFTSVTSTTLDEQEEWTPSDRAILGLMCVPLFDADQAEECTCTGSDTRVLCSAWNTAGIMVSGCPVTTYDEDTLLGIFRLYHNRYLAGQEPWIERRAPQATRTSFPEAADRITPPPSWASNEIYQFGIAELQSLIDGRERGAGCSDRERAARIESLERLSNMTLSFRCCGKPERGRVNQSPMMKLFDRFEEVSGTAADKRLTIRMTPMAAPLMTHYVSRIDLAVRRGLSPLGKALHRLLASQAHGPGWDAPFETLLEAIGVPEGRVKIRYSSRQQLERMVALGFLRTATLRRDGRSGSDVLQVEFSQQSWWLGNPFGAMPDTTGAFDIEPSSVAAMCGLARVLDFSDPRYEAQHREPRFVSRARIDESCYVANPSCAQPSSVSTAEHIEARGPNWSETTAAVAKDRDGSHGHSRFEFPDGARGASESLGTLLELAIKVSTELSSWLVNTRLAIDKPQWVASSLKHLDKPEALYNQALQDTPLHRAEGVEDQPMDLLGLVNSLGVTLEQLAVKNALLYQSLPDGSTCLHPVSSEVAVDFVIPEAGVRAMPEPPGSQGTPAPNVEKRFRKRFSTAEKLRILDEADACGHRGLGALLRREKLSSSQFQQWLRESAKHGVPGKPPPGPAASKSPQQRRIKQLELEKAQLVRQLTITEERIGLEKKNSLQGASQFCWRGPAFDLE
jgi:transposase